VKKTYSIITFGCQMNKNDSELMAGLLEKEGYTESSDPKKGDVILLNTCSVRERAELKAQGYLGHLKTLKKENPAAIIAVTGCAAEREGEEWQTRAPFVDSVIGPNKIHKLPELVNFVEQGGGCAVAVGHEEPMDYGCLPMTRQKSVNARVTIMYGCNKFCTYCIVPTTRGRERSRPIESILEEVRALDKTMFKEICFLGQIVDNYGYDLEKEYGLGELLRQANKIEGLERIRFLTSYPKTMDPGIIDAIAECDKVCEYIHLPIQAGDDEILREMNRGYTVDQYREIAGQIRAKIPGCSLTTDIIVGFPGETDVQYRKSLALIEEMEFDTVNTAAYSPRPGTVAFKMEDRVDDAVKKERLKEINQVVSDVALKVNRRLVGQTLQILVESITEDGRLKGRTRTNKVVLAEVDPAGAGSNPFLGSSGGRGPSLDSYIGQLVNIDINWAGSWGLRGTIR
jgi:tRNA-2-methylthio-N6-dimethylallyladenosine synthase